MTVPAVVKQDLSDDDVLAYTQRIRRNFVDELIVNKLPVDDKVTAGLMLQTLHDMDRTALGKKKIVIEQGQSESDRIVAQALAELSKNPNLGNVFNNNNSGITIDADLSRLPIIEHVPGQDAVGLEDRTYDAFIIDVEGPSDEA